MIRDATLTRTGIRRFGTPQSQGKQTWKFMKIAYWVPLVVTILGMPLMTLGAGDTAHGSINGKGEAPLALAMSFFKGQGVEKDDVLAARYFRMAADQGNADAQDMLGLLYKFGQDVSKDSREAVKWFLVAAESGHSDARNNLGAMYSSGLGVPQDFKEAVK